MHSPLMSDSNAFTSLNLIIRSIWCLVSYYWLLVPQQLVFCTHPAGGTAGPGGSLSAGHAAPSPVR